MQYPQRRRRFVALLDDRDHLPHVAEVEKQRIVGVDVRAVGAVDGEQPTAGDRVGCELAGTRIDPMHSGRRSRLGLGHSDECRDAAPVATLRRVDSVAVGLVAGYAADRMLGDPRRFHPVAGLGRILGSLERELYRDTRSAGVAYAAVAVGGMGLASALVTRRLRSIEPVLVATATWAVLGGTTLAGVGEQMADNLDAGDIDAARALIPSLCGRDPQSLDADGMCRAAVESIAENTSDATVAPVVWGAVAGVPGLVAYRTVNTLDAMVGYRSARYLNFGWASARFDDLANVVPARLSGLLVVVLGPDPASSWAAWHRDAGKHPSPNAGVVEASFAGALGIGLGGRTVYAHGEEMRPQLGSGPAPGSQDLRAAVRLSRRVQTGTVVVAVGYRLLRAVLSRRSAG